MAGPPKHRESYSKGDDTINYVEYEGRYGGDDKVLQHLKMGAETAHITIHPGQPPHHTDVICRLDAGPFEVLRGAHEENVQPEHLHYPLTSSRGLLFHVFHP